MASDPKVHTFAEVAKHNQMKDCWLIIHGKVYDVTPFMKYHPGGDEILLAASDNGRCHCTSATSIADDKYIMRLLNFGRV